MPVDSGEAGRDAIDGTAAGRSSAVADPALRLGEITAEIEATIGFFPAFLTPALSVPEVLDSLWRQTVWAHVENPLPALFKERLLAYLSRYCTVAYPVVCHSCALRPLGMRGNDVLALLLQAPPVGPGDVEQHRAALAEEAGPLRAWPEPGSKLDRALHGASVAVFVDPGGWKALRSHVRRVLGPDLYEHWAVFLGYVRAYLFWVEAHPDLSYEADHRVQEHLAPLVSEEPALGEFFESYERSLGAAVNVFERGRAEEALRASEERFRTFVECAPDAVVIVDPGGRVVLTNAQTEALFGYDREELAGYPVEKVLPERLRRSDVFCGRHKDGREFPVDISLSPLHTEEGLLLAATVRDISERQRVEEALAESEGRLADAQRLAHLGSWHWDLRHLRADEVSWSDELYDIYGMHAEECTPTYETYLAQVHPEDRDQVRTAVERTLLTHEPFAHEYRILRPDGGLRWVAAQGTDQVDGAGNTVALRGVCLDITERKLMEEQVEAGRKEMDAIKDTFLRTVSHDLQNPLIVIAGLAGVLAETPEAPVEERLETLGRIERNALLLQRMVSTFLDSDRLALLEERPHRRPTDLAALVARVLEGLDTSGHPLVLEVAPVVTLLVDPDYFERIVANLVGNALAHTESGTPIWIRLTGDAAEVTLAVEDGGPGVAAEVRETIFERFRTGHSTAARTGLGLWVVARCAQLHGGRAWVEDRPGGGASFRVLVPAEDP